MPLSPTEIASRILKLPPDKQKLATQAFKMHFEGKLLNPQKQQDASHAKDSLKEFIFQAWQFVDPKPLSWNWHLDEFCLFLTQFYLGEIKRGIVNVPPGSSKSMIFSVLFNAWVWANDASKQFLTASYTIDLTLRDNRRLRNIIRSDWYREHFNVNLSSEQSAKERFETTKGGWRIATSVGGIATGEHPDGFIIIDDPLKAADSRSEAKLLEANTWIDNTISTRVMHDPGILLIMQRLNEDDPSGHLLAKGGWEHLCFPMRFESKKANSNDIRNVPDPRDHRIDEGELLWPDMWPERKVQEEELLLGLAASGQLQQRPVPDGGLLYNREWFQYTDKIDEPIDECRGWDIAETDASEKAAKRNNWTVGTKISRGRRTGRFYVSDNIRVQQTFVDDLIKTTADMDGLRCKIREGSGSGKSTIAARASLLAGYDYEASPETSASGDKIQRNNPFRAQCQARNVWIVRGPWNEVYISVLCSFPLGRCNDDVDSSSNAFNGLIGIDGEDEWVTF